MANKNIDKETQEVISEQRKAFDLVQDEKWGFATDKLYEFLNDANSLRGLEKTDPQEMFLEVEAKRMAVEIVLGWVKEIEGLADQYNQHVGNKKNEEEIIRNYEK